MDNNPILNIQPQLEGGNSVSIKKLIGNAGAKLDLYEICPDKNNMNELQIWLSEYYDSVAILINDINLVKKICDRESLNLNVIGFITDDGTLTINNGENELIKNYNYNTNNLNNRNYLIKKSREKIHIPRFISDDLDILLHTTLSCLDVCSKRFITNKLDRSVSGLIVQQQCVGPIHTPLSNYGLISSSYFANNRGVFTGMVSSIGEQPICGLVNSKKMAEKTFAEAILNIIWVYLEDIKNIKMSIDWIWNAPEDDPNEGYKIYETTMK